MVRTIFAMTLLISSAAVAKMPGPDDLVHVHNGFLLARDYRAEPEIERAGYVMGVVDGVFLAPLLGGDQQATRALATCVEGMNNVQLVAIVDRFLDNNPAEWDHYMHTQVFRALRQACAARSFPEH